MSDVARGAITIDHLERRVANVRQLVKHAMRNENRLARRKRLPLFAQAHLAGSFDDEVNLLLVLVVPGNLPALWFQRDKSHAEILCLDGRYSADKVLGATTRRIGASFDLFKVGDNHCKASSC